MKETRRTNMLIQKQWNQKSIKKTLRKLREAKGMRQKERRKRLTITGHRATAMSE